MIAIFKKEIKQYYNSIVGYVFLSIFLLMSGYYFTVGNLFSQNSDIRAFFSNLVFIIIFIIPMLTMRLFSEERKMKTDQFLFTAPLSYSGIVLGKFFASLSVLFTGFIFTIPYVFTLSSFGSIEPWVVAGNYLAVILAGMCFISIGIFISSLTENQVIAAIVTYCALFGLWLISWMSEYIQSAVLQNIIKWVSIYERYRDFSLGLFNPASVIYYFSITVVFLSFTIWILDQRRWSFEWKAAKDNKSFKSNTFNYRVGPALTIFAIAVIGVLLNICSTILVDDYNMKFDMTKSKMYDITEPSQNIISKLGSQVDIYCFNSEKNFIRELREVMTRYDKASDKIKVHYVNPYENPAFVDKYVSQGIEIGINTVIVESEKRNKFLHTQDFFKFDPQMTKIVGLAAEQQITSAIMNVTIDDLPAVSFISGHGENPSTSLSNLFKENNFKIQNSNLITESIDETVDIIVVCSPQKDFLPEEINKMDAFLQRGGKMMLFREPGVENLKNLDSYIEEWGIGISDNAVFEKELFYASSPINVVATYANHEITETFSKNTVYTVMPATRGLELLFTDKNGIEVKPVLTSSKDAYGKKGTTFSTPQMEKSDVHGPFTLGATSVMNIKSGDKSKQAKIFVAGSSAIYADQVLSTGSFGNGTLLSKIVDWAVEKDNTINILPKNIGGETLNIFPYQAYILGGLFIVLIPLVIFIFGLTVWFRRRYL